MTGNGRRSAGYQREKVGWLVALSVVHKITRSRGFGRPKKSKSLAARTAVDGILRGVFNEREAALKGGALNGLS